MNAKTYGQILTEETVKRINDRMTSDGYDKAQEEIARAVILEFVRRVDERAEELSNKPGPRSFYHTFENDMVNAFTILSTKLKEAK